MSEPFSRIVCTCCGETKKRVKIRRGDVWRSKFTDGQGLRGPSVRIIAPDKDGAVIEQVGREEIDGRFGMSYRHLVGNYERVVASTRERP
jgi:hypothetical protein